MYIKNLNSQHRGSLSPKWDENQGYQNCVRGFVFEKIELEKLPSRRTPQRAKQKRIETIIARRDNRLHDSHISLRILMSSKIVRQCNHVSVRVSRLVSRWLWVQDTFHLSVKVCDNIAKVVEDTRYVLTVIGWWKFRRPRFCKYGLNRLTKIR